ncbi:MAG: cell surface protein, partial [Rubripirellula sp.]
MMRRLSVTLAFLMVTATSGNSAEPAPAAASSSTGVARTKVNLAVFPETIQLDTARDYQSFIAVVRRPDDVTLEVTETAAWKLTNEKFARIEGNKLVPVADGETELVCDFGDTQIRVPVKVTRSAEKLPISFEKDIVPIMTRSGCNTGSCHGAARGKDGFMISLFGYDPAGDYDRITRE